MLGLRCDESVVKLLVLRCCGFGTVLDFFRWLVSRRESSGPAFRSTLRALEGEARESRSTRERERERGRASSFELSGFGPAHRQLVESVSVWGGAPPMSIVSDDFGLRYLIFHSFHERYTQAFISIVTYVMMPKFNGYQHHL